VGDGFQKLEAKQDRETHVTEHMMPWLHVKYNYFKIISAFVDVRLKYFYFSA